MMGTRSLPASIQPSSDWSRGWPGSDWAMPVPMHTGLVDLHSSFARSRRSRNGVGFDLSGVHWSLFPGHGATVDTENADTEELPRKVCESTSPAISVPPSSPTRHTKGPTPRRRPALSHPQSKIRTPKSVSSRPGACRCRRAGPRSSGSARPGRRRRCPRTPARGCSRGTAPAPRGPARGGSRSRPS